MIITNVAFLKRFFCIFSIGIFSVGCTTTKVPSFACDADFDKKIEKIEEEEKKVAAANYEYAILSHNVYLNHIYASRVDGIGLKVEPANGHPEIWLDPKRWKAVCSDKRKSKNTYDSDDYNSCQPKKYPSGLEVQTYYKYDVGNMPPKMMVIVIRGTEFSKFKDIFSNIIPIQHAHAEDYLEKQRVAYSEKFPEAAVSPDIVAVGHSLGGAIAQHLTYCFDGVKSVGFNTSLFVNRGTCSKDDEPYNNDMYTNELYSNGRYSNGRYSNEKSSNEKSSNEKSSNEKSENITRIYQKGEILRVVTKFFRFFFPNDGVVADFNLVAGNPIERHKIGHLAIGLTKVVACSVQSSSDSGLVKVEAEKVLDVSSKKKDESESGDKSSKAEELAVQSPP